jgi:hypothetical protein
MFKTFLSLLSGQASYFMNLFKDSNIRIVFMATNSLEHILIIKKKNPKV